MKKTNRIMRAGVLAALAGWTTAGYTAGFQLIEQNGSGLGNAYSGQAAAAENSSTVYFNPAGMGTTRRVGCLPAGRTCGASILDSVINYSHRCRLHD